MKRILIITQIFLIILPLILLGYDYLDYHYPRELEEFENKVNSIFNTKEKVSCNENYDKCIKLPLPLLDLSLGA